MSEYREKKENDNGWTTKQYDITMIGDGVWMMQVMQDTIEGMPIVGKDVNDVRTLQM